MNQNGKEIKKLFFIASALAALLFCIYVLEKISGYIARKERDKILSEEITVTIPEGYNVFQIGEALERAGLFKAGDFVNIAEQEEGYLFPDTYRFYKVSSPQRVAAKMRDNFDRKITPEILGEIKKENKKLPEIIIMASLLEEEASSTYDRKIISGILWKRLKNGMGLEVDSAPMTYKYRGLPPAPIANPGMDAILAALYPSPSFYFYYVSDKSGRLHYAVTFAEHISNVYKYLKN